MRATEQWVGISEMQRVDPGVGRRVFKNVATSVCCPLCRIRIKVGLAKGKSLSSDLGILYPLPEISNSNFNFKLCWREILLLAPQNYFLLASTGILLGIGYPQRFIWGISLCFTCWGLLDFYFLEKIHQFTKSTRLPMLPLTQSPTTYISQT